MENNMPDFTKCRRNIVGSTRHENVLQNRSYCMYSERASYTNSGPPDDTSILRPSRGTQKVQQCSGRHIMREYIPMSGMWIFQKKLDEGDKKLMLNRKLIVMEICAPEAFSYFCLPFFRRAASTGWITHLCFSNDIYGACMLIIVPLPEAYVSHVYQQAIVSFFGFLVLLPSLFCRRSMRNNAFCVISGVNSRRDVDDADHNSHIQTHTSHTPCWVCQLVWATLKAGVLVCCVCYDDNDTIRKWANS